VLEKLPDIPRATTVSYARCEIASYLDGILDKHPDVAIEFHIARLMVSCSSIDVESGVRVFLDGGQIENDKRGRTTDRLESGLRSCLKNISKGNCVEYPKLAL
jgi:hypothetical protein